MKIVTKLILLLSVFLGNRSLAQPYTLQSVGLSKPFSLSIYFGDGGKGAFVKYQGQTHIIALRIKSYHVDKSGRSDGQPDVETLVWDELIDGKINGRYGLTKTINGIDNIWYLRNKDNKRLKLQNMEHKGDHNDDQYLLHGALIRFNHFDNNKLNIQYPDGKRFNAALPDFDSPNAARQSTIADYNFDGYDDLAFSIPDAGMGVYRMFSIWLYNPVSKRFDQLSEPDYGKAGCSCLCDVTLDQKRKLFLTSCRGGAKWWQDEYRFTANNRLVWVRSAAQHQN